MGGERVRVWLDDVRQAPPGWVRTFAPEQVIALLRSGRMAELSLDHDLGLEPGRTGYAVLVWLESEVAAGRWPGPLPEISVHSANPVGRRRMLRLLDTIRRLHGTSCYPTPDGSTAPRSGHVSAVAPSPAAHRSRIPRET